MPNNVHVDKSNQQEQDESNTQEKLSENDDNVVIQTESNSSETVKVLMTDLDDFNDWM